MIKAKLPLIILLIFLIITGFFAYTFYSQVQALQKENSTLTDEKDQLVKQNNGLRQKIRRLDQEKASLSQKNNSLEKNLAEAERAQQSIQNKYTTVARDRDKLIETIKELKTAQQPKTQEQDAQKRLSSGAGASGEMWADVVQEKAELQAKLEDMHKVLLDAKTKSAQLEKDNKELSLKIDELMKGKERIDMEITFKERTMEIMSRDLVSEREARRKIAQELAKLRDENIELKRELIVANKEKIDLQGKLKNNLEKREDLQKTVSQVENILKQKAMVFSELETQLTKAVKGNAAAVTGDSASVELPPIVVKSDASPGSLRGEILAVNKNENFVIIDLGEEAGVKPANIFNVLRNDTVIGTVEVIETRREISAADIKEAFSGYTLREGDAVLLK